MDEIPQALQVSLLGIHTKMFRGKSQAHAETAKLGNKSHESSEHEISGISCF